MSLEHIIMENTIAMKHLNAALVDLCTQLAATNDAKPAAPKTTQAETTTPKESATASVDVEEKAPPPEDTAPKEPTYQDAAKAIIDLAKAKGRAAGAEVLSQFGVATLPDLPSEKFAEVIEAAKKALAG